MTATVPYAALSEIAEFFNLNYTDLIEVVDDFEKANPQPADIAPEAPQHCMCPACAAGTIHASDCAVHGIEPGVVGACDCRAAPEAAEPVTVTDEMILAACKAGHWRVRAESIRDVRAALVAALSIATGRAAE